jgi:hypothetical protein
MFTALSLQIKDVVDNLESVIAFAPIYLIKNTRSTLLQQLAKTDLDVVLEKIGIKGILGPNYLSG